MSKKYSIQYFRSEFSFCFIALKVLYGIYEGSSSIILRACLDSNTFGRESRWIRLPSPVVLHGFNHRYITAAHYVGWSCALQSVSVLHPSLHPKTWCNNTHSQPVNIQKAVSQHTSKKHLHATQINNIFISKSGKTNHICWLKCIWLF